MRDRNIKLSLTKAEDSFLEAWLSRGDRRMAEVVYSAPGKMAPSLTPGMKAVSMKHGCSL